MSQTPPPPPLPTSGYAPLDSAPPAGSQTNGPAIASLICGLLGCVPFVTGAVAIALGWAGLRKTRDPRVGGKGLAVAGLVLGIISLGGWLVIGGMVGAAYAGSRPARATARQFLADLTAGNTAGATAACTPAITAANVRALADQVHPWGALNDVTFDSYKVNSQFGSGTHHHMTGRATYANGMHTVSFDLLKQGRMYKVFGVQIQ